MMVEAKSLSNGILAKVLGNA